MPDPQPVGPTQEEIEKAWVRPPARTRTAPGGQPRTVRRNDQGREIWFDRILWSYAPCHWKGFVFPIPIILAAVLTGMWASQAHPALMAVPMLIAWAVLMWICERHSPSRH
jgi:hypothetical protein